MTSSNDKIMNLEMKMKVDRLKLRLTGQKKLCLKEND